MKAPSEEIYGKSTKEHSVEKYIQWVITLSLTIRAYLRSFNSYCFPNLRNPAEFF